MNMKTYEEKYKIAETTETYKQLTSNRPVKEINEIAWELVKKYEANGKITEADKEAHPHPDPDLELEDWVEKTEEHMKYWMRDSKQFELTHAVWRFAFCTRRSIKMKSDLVNSIVEAIEQDLTVY